MIKAYMYIIHTRIRDDMCYTMTKNVLKHVLRSLQIKSRRR